MVLQSHPWRVPLYRHQSFFYQLFRRVYIAKAVKLHDLSFVGQLLVYLEERFDALLLDSRQIGNRLDAVIRRIDIRCGHCDDFLVRIFPVHHI
jgi:hypothetical protein